MHRSGERWGVLESRRHVLALALVSGLLVAGCGKEQPASTPPGPMDAAETSPTAGDADPLHPVVRLETNHGAITVRLDAVNAPGTVRNFLDYVSDGFYSQTLIHYVQPDKMILGGGFSVDGKPKPAGRSIRNEAHNGLKNVRGTIAMARDVAAGIDTATSQFFINLADDSALDHRGDTAAEYGYCVFGEVVDGLDVAERISRAPTRDLGGDLVQMPDPPVVVTSVRAVP